MLPIELTGDGSCGVEAVATSMHGAKCSENKGLDLISVQVAV